LNASIIIYDKRVENLSIETDKMSGKMTRISNDDSNSEESTQARSRRRRTGLVSIDDLDEGIDQGAVNTLEIDKLDIRDAAMLINGDPLFQKQLQAFDNNQLSGLFLNHFELDATLSVSFFSNKQAYKQSE
jgi:hypothetical protein